MGDDIAAIESWAQIFTNPAELAATISKHYLLHKKEISADISAVTTDWDSQEYFQTGEAIAKLMTDAVGPIQESYTIKSVAANMVPDVISGWIYSMDGNSFSPYTNEADYLAYWESCISLSAADEETLSEAIAIID